MKVESVILEGETVRLEPLSIKHFDDLAEVAFDPEIWRWTLGKIETEGDLRKYIEEAAEGTKVGLYLAFAVIKKDTGKAIGATRFGSISTEYKRVEIGWTWYGKDFRRTRVNTECKFLLLKHAFEELKCIRVYLQTDVLNERSQNAILRIGAKKEGIFRKDKITKAGRIRDSIIFGITNDDWEIVKANLLEKLSRANL